MYNVNRTQTFTALAALVLGQMVTISGARSVDATGPGQTPDGVVVRDCASGEEVAVALFNAGGTFEVMASGTFSAGAILYSQASGTVDAIRTGRSILRALQASTASGDIIEAIVTAAGQTYGLIYVNTAASSAVTNTTTETAFDVSASLPANTLKAGDVLRIKFQGIATATNSTDTLAINLKVGSVTVLALAAVDVANSDIFEGEMDVVVRTIGAPGTIVAHGQAPVIGAAGTATCRPRFLASSTLDTTAAVAITVTATWSVANAGNSCRLDILSVERVRTAA